MKDSYFFAMDSETGGLDPKLSDILTLYISVTDEDFKILDELDLKLKPNDRNPIADPGALAVNKIDLQKHLADPNTVTYAEAKSKILALAKKYLRKRGRYSNLIVLGQNVMFDLNFIWEHLIPKSEWEANFSYNIEDTKTASLFLKRCGWLPPDIGTLKSLVEYFNIPKRTEHEARGDVFACLDVYKKMIELMKCKKDGGSLENTDLIKLLESE